MVYNKPFKCLFTGWKWCGVYSQASTDQHTRDNKAFAIAERQRSLRSKGWKYVEVSGMWTKVLHQVDVHIRYNRVNAYNENLIASALSFNPHILDGVQFEDAARQAIGHHVTLANGEAKTHPKICSALHRPGLWCDDGERLAMAGHLAEKWISSMKLLSICFCHHTNLNCASLAKLPFFFHYSGYMFVSSDGCCRSC